MMKAYYIRYVITNQDNSKFATGMDSFTKYLPLAKYYHNEDEAGLDLSDWLDKEEIFIISPAKITIELMEE